MSDILIKGKLSKIDDPAFWHPVNLWICRVGIEKEKGEVLVCATFEGSTKQEVESMREVFMDAVLKSPSMNAGRVISGCLPLDGTEVNGLLFARPGLGVSKLGKQTPEQSEKGNFKKSGTDIGDFEYVFDYSYCGRCNCNKGR